MNITLGSILQEVLAYALRVALAAGVLLLGRYLARRTKLIVAQLLTRPQVHEHMTPTLERLILQTTFYSIMVAAVVIALSLIGVPPLLIASATTTLLIIIAVALRESLANLAATIIFYVFQPFKAGEVVETMGHTGTVEEIQLFNTIIRQFDQRMVSLPNNQIQESGVINLTRNGVVRADVRMVVSYSANLDRVRVIVDEIMSSDPRVLNSPRRDILFLETGQDGILMEVRAFATTGDFFKLASDLRERIMARFKNENIEIAPARQEIQLIEGKNTDKVNG
jgi:small conductance mechanosensitive channel